LAWDQQVPAGNGFPEHVGYATKLHLDALKTYGPSPIHRRTFRGVVQKEEISLAIDRAIGVNK